MIKTLLHFSDLHIRLFKDHDLYKSILEEAINHPVAKITIATLKGFWEEVSPEDAKKEAHDTLKTRFKTYFE
jgi:hypothetical protein